MLVWHLHYVTIKRNKHEGFRVDSDDVTQRLLGRRRHLVGMPYTQCARSAKFCMSANTRTLVLALGGAPDAARARRVRGAEIRPCGPPKHPQFLPRGPLV